MAAPALELQCGSNSTMSKALFGHSFIVATILFTVYSQMIMRWQVGHAGPLPVDLAGRAAFVGNLLLNPWVISGVVATFFAGVSWMLTMTRYEVSYAYPFMSLNYILVLALSIAVFGESMSVGKIVGTALIVMGTVVIARG